MTRLEAADLAAWTGGRWSGRATPVAGVSTDTRNLLPGTLFVALRGPTFDGHRFLDDAFRRGAAAAMVATVPDPAPGPLLRVPDTGRALQDLAAGYAARNRALRIAVTGSVGKTTVKDMLADVLAAGGPVARNPGNWNNAVGLPLSLLAMAPSAAAGVFELGVNHPGEMAVLVRVLRPAWGVVTSIGPVHLEGFGSVEGVTREKGVLLEALPATGAAFLNRDDPFFPALAARAACPVVSVGAHPRADYRLEPGAAPDAPFTVIEQASGERGVLRLPLPGAHQAANALLAVAAGRRRGLGWDAIAAALAAFRGQPMRWERSTLAGVTVINDAYNANPVSMAAALRTFAALPAAGARWLVLAGMRELGASQDARHRDLGAALAGGPWAGLVTVGPLGALLAQAARAAGMPGARVLACPDHAAAARVLSERLRPGDAVLFKASRGERLEDVLALWKAAAGRNGIAGSEVPGCGAAASRVPGTPSPA